MNAWVWSSVFHIRDFIFTERADYFSAAASIMYGLFYTALRIFDVHTRDMKVVQPYIYAWGGLCTILFLAHVSYLSFVTFSYSYNMAANVAVGMIQNAMWIYFSITRSRSNRGHWVWIPVYVVVYVCFAMSLEIFDFFPIADALDAHALWHLATVPMVLPPVNASDRRPIYFMISCSRIPSMRSIIHGRFVRSYRLELDIKTVLDTPDNKTAYA